MNILDFKFFKKRKNFFHLASIHLEKPDARLTDDLKLVFIELPKLHLHENMTLQEKWLIFLNPRVSFSEKEKIAMNDAAMTDAVNSCKLFSSDFVRRWKYEQEEIAMRTRISAINYVIDEAEKRGEKRAEKRTEKKTCIKNAVTLMKNGAALDLVAKSLNFTKQELLALAKKIKSPSKSNLVVRQIISLYDSKNHRFVI